MLVSFDSRLLQAPGEILGARLARADCLQEGGVSESTFVKWRTTPRTQKMAVPSSMRTTTTEATMSRMIMTSTHEGGSTSSLDYGRVR